jgi:hypothetical protein
MTTPPGNMSEVAAALAAITAEYEASQLGLSGLSAVARHANIIAQQQRISDSFHDLAALVGDDMQAMALFAATLEHIVPGSEGSHAH